MPSSSATYREIERRYAHIVARLSPLPHGNFVSSLLPGGPQPLVLLFGRRRSLRSVKLTLLQEFEKFRSPLFIRGIEFIQLDANGEPGLVPAKGSATLSSFYEQYGGFPNFAVNEVQEPYAFHTKMEHSPFAEITLEEAVEVDGIRLHTRLRQHETVSMQALQISIRENGSDEWEEVFNYPAILRNFLTKGAEAFPPEPASGFTHTDAVMVDGVLTEALLGNYDYYRMYHRFGQMSAAVDTTAIVNFLDEAIAKPRGLTATAYGINCPFSMWSEGEKITVLDAALALIEKLKTISPNVCFAFGTALGFVREGGFIPHDRDVDIYLGLDDRTYPLREEDFRELEQRLTDLGLWVVWINKNNSLPNAIIASHVPKLSFLDVYLCAPEKGQGTYYDANGVWDKRMQRADIFPPTYVEIYGRQCPVPGRPEQYLTSAYGEKWRIPIDMNSNISKERKKYRAQ
ncbi:LicD family protein [Desulfovibrio sp. OttesenSCG-928-G15]|nr:LicD family protein [Desulfovibrio sp. OttesenSCG-928-G15]